MIAVLIWHNLEKPYFCIERTLRKLHCSWKQVFWRRGTETTEQHKCSWFFFRMQYINIRIRTKSRPAFQCADHYGVLDKICGIIVRLWLETRFYFSDCGWVGGGKSWTLFYVTSLVVVVRSGHMIVDMAVHCPLVFLEMLVTHNSRT